MGATSLLDPSVGLALMAPGLLDANGQFDPQAYQRARQNYGMLGLAAGLLAGSGPSRLPVTFGSAFGAGLQGMMGAEQAFNKNAMTGAQTGYYLANTGKLGIENQILRQQASLYPLLLGSGTGNLGPEPSHYLPATGGGSGGIAAPAASGTTTAAADTTGGDDLLSNPSPIAGLARYADLVANNESGGNPNAKNPRSSATGLGQFTNATWLTLAHKYFPETAQMGDDALLALRSDPGFSRRMIAAYGEDNAQALSGAGIPVNNATLYAAHFLGPKGAIDVLSASPDTPLSSLLSPQVMAANPNLKGKSAGQFAANMAMKMNVSGPLATTMAPSGQPSAQQSSFDPNVWAARHQIPIGLDGAGRMVPIDDRTGQPIYNAPGYDYGWAQRNAEAPPQGAADAPSASPAAGQPAAAAPAMTLPAPTGGGQQVNPAWVQYQNAKVAGLENQIKAWSFLGKTPPPTLVEQWEMERGKLSLPYIEQAAAAKAQGQFYGPQASPTLQGQIAGERARAQAPYELFSGRPGAIVYNRLGQPIGVNPILTKTVDAQGNEHPAFAMPPLPGGATPGSVSPLSITNKLGPGIEKSLETRATEEQKQRQEVIDDANSAQQQRATLMNMVNEAGNFVQGPFADHAQEAARYLRLIFPSYNGQVASYEDFVKNAGSLTRQAVREVSSRAAVQEFNLIQNTLPNPDMSPQGMQRVQNELVGLTDYKIAKAQAQQAWEQQHGGLGNVSGFETAWQKAASPYAFIVARMAPMDRRAMIAKLNDSAEGRQELGHLQQQLQYLKQSGLAE